MASELHLNPDEEEALDAAWEGEAHRAFGERLRSSPRHLRAVRKWLGGGHEGIRAAQAGRSLSPWGAGPIPDSPDAVAAFEEAAAMAPSYRGEAHRGLGVPRGHPLLKALSRAGTVLGARSHSSWSKQEDPARYFADARSGEQRVPVVLHLSPGARFADLSGPAGGASDEHEVVLPKGARLRVANSATYRDADGVIHARLEPVPEGELAAPVPHEEGEV